MDDEATSETLIVEGRTVVTAETVERPPSERPVRPRSTNSPGASMPPAFRSCV
jgi:hypothetical protein